MAKDRPETKLDRELDDLPNELRWREWMRRIEAVLFASASPVPSEDLARVVGQGVSVEMLIQDLIADLAGRSFEVAKVPGGWMLRTRPTYAPAIKAAADVGDQDLDLREYVVAVLAAIAYHQPITRDGLKDIFGKELSQFYPIMMVNGNYQLQLPTETISFVSRYVSGGRSECTYGELIVHVDSFFIIAMTGNIRDEGRIFSIHSMQSEFSKFIYNC